MSPLREGYNRRSIRLKGYDYSLDGAYFVTICTHEGICLFGEALGGSARLNEIGLLVDDEWLRTASIRPHILIDEFVVMPNHLHGIIIFTHGTRRGDPAGRPYQAAGPISGSLGAIVGQFKSAATKRINALRATPGARVWQRNYYEHVIRTEDDLNAIRQYILDNPARWEEDRYNPLHHRRGTACRAPTSRSLPG